MNARDFLPGRAHQCERKRGAFPAMIAVNLYRQGDLPGVVDKLNKMGPSGAAETGG